MAGKKKKAVKKAKADPCGCGCGCGNGNIEEYMLIFVAGVGLVNALGMIAFPYYVPIVLYVLVGVMGVKKLLDKQACSC